MAERRTSVAKDVLEQRIDNALERYGMVSDEFNTARIDDPSQVHENAHLTGQASQMVANDKPQAVMRPPADMARPVDREAFDQRWADEQNRASQRDDAERGDDFER